MLGLKMPWTRRREREAAAAMEAAETAQRLEQRRAIARELAAQVRVARGIQTVRRVRA
jgi:hypothetical protein